MCNQNIKSHYFQSPENERYQNKQKKGKEKKENERYQEKVPLLYSRLHIIVKSVLAWLTVRSMCTFVTTKQDVISCLLTFMDMISMPLLSRHINFLENLMS